MLAAPLIGLACYAARRENIKLLLLSLGLLLLVREDMGVYVALFGLYWLCCYPVVAGLALRSCCRGGLDGWVALLVLPLLRAGTDQALGGARPARRYWPRCAIRWRCC